MSYLIHKRHSVLITWLMILVGICLFGMASRHSLKSETLHDAFIQAYTNNPALHAARSELKAIDEGVAAAQGGRRPQVQITGQVTPQWRKESAITQGEFENNNEAQVNLEVIQPLYQGGRISARIRQSENQVRMQRARLRNIEQMILLQAATAYLNVIRDQAVLDLRINNEHVLERQLNATRDRFNVGEITRTDISQAESRVARATAERIQAQGQLISSQATYKRVIGIMPENLQEPQIDIDLPTSLNEVIAQAIAHDPNVLSARYIRDAANDGIDIAEGELWPRIDLRGSVSQTRNDLSENNDRASAQVGIQITIPLYSSGISAAQTRSARQIAHQRNLEIMDAVRRAEERAVQAWYSLLTARSTIQSRQVQVSTVQIALDGVRQEERVGSRTVLDVLDAEQEVLDAQVELVSVQRDELVAIFTLLAAMGDLTIEQLNLQVEPYDEEAYYHQARGRLWGSDIE